MAIDTKITCLRCDTELTRYHFVQLGFMPLGERHRHVLLECPKCGHVELLARNSPLVPALRAIPTFVGDGD
jgi:hypothetical protein